MLSACEACLACACASAKREPCECALTDEALTRLKVVLSVFNVLFLGKVQYQYALVRVCLVSDLTACCGTADRQCISFGYRGRAVFSRQELMIGVQTGALGSAVSLPEGASCTTAMNTTADTLLRLAPCAIVLCTSDRNTKQLRLQKIPLHHLISRVHDILQLLKSFAVDPCFAGPAPNLDSCQIINSSVCTWEPAQLQSVQSALNASIVRLCSVSMAGAAPFDC